MRTPFILLLCISANAWSAPDGPYVLHDAADGWESMSVETVDGRDRKLVVALKRGASITVNAVGDVPAFKVKLREAAKPGPDEFEVAPSAPLFVVADTHGEYEILVTMLRNHGVINPKLAWKFGKGHLVLLGDVFDRGPNHLEILWLIYQLEAEARRAGGGVHLLLGNHETMALMADLRYLNPKYVETAATLGVGNYPALFDARSVLGQWLRTLPAVIRVNDLLCLHAGVSRALIDSGLSLREINAGVRSVLDEVTPSDGLKSERAQLLLGPLGPLWYRGYFSEQASYPIASAEDIDLALKKFAVARILIGHTIVPVITPLFAGKVIAVQVYPRRMASGDANFESLLVKGGELWRARLDGTLEKLL